MVDEVTGRMYVLRGDTLERIPEVASRRRVSHPVFLGGAQGCEPLQLRTPQCQWLSPLDSHRTPPLVLPRW